MNDTRRDGGPMLTAARLFRKQSAAGGTYFVGRMGALRVLVLKSRETADDGAEIWNLCLAEAPAKPAGSNTGGAR